MNCTKCFLHGKGRNKDRITVFILTIASSAWSLSLGIKHAVLLKFVYLCEVFLCFDIPTLWGNTVNSDYVPPIFIFLCWKRPDRDSHLHTDSPPPPPQSLAKEKNTSVSQYQAEERATHLLRFLRIFVYSIISMWEWHACIEHHRWFYARVNAVSGQRAQPSEE